MISGKLRHRVEVQSATETADSFGQRIPTWTTIVTRWAGIEPLTGRESEAARQIQADVSHKVLLRYYPITPLQRLKFGNRIFNIVSVLNKEERNLEITCYCVEKV